MPNIAFVRTEVSMMKCKWDIVRDCLKGEKAIKDARTKYLPMPNEADQSTENKKRYEAYIGRAAFYPVTESTCAGLLGQVFDTDPIIEIPTEIDYYKTDITGSGISLCQSASKTLAEVLAYGRSGLLLDYPALDTVSRLDVQLGFARPITVMYSPEAIINWRHITRGAKTMLTMVVFNECYVVQDDGFEMKEGFQWRVCRCDESTGWLYKVELWIEDGNDYIVKEEYWPKDALGNQLDFIPFTFVGAMNNDASPDHPPLYGIASLNVKHYRNSADYEDSCYIVGQPTPVYTGLTKDWVDTVMSGSVELGSRGSVNLPKGATATLLQAAPNGMVKEAMDQKEAQMTALGAQLVQPQNVSRTLGEAKMDKNAQTSILAKCAQNVSDAYTQILSWTGLFISGEVYDQEEVYVKLSTSFAIAKMSPQEMMQLVATWQGGLLTFNEARAQLRSAGVATEDDEAAKEAIDAESQARSALALDAFNSDPANSDPNNPGNDPNADPQNQGG